MAWAGATQRRAAVTVMGDVDVDARLINGPYVPERRVSAVPGSSQVSGSLSTAPGRHGSSLLREGRGRGWLIATLQLEECKVLGLLPSRSQAGCAVRRPLYLPV